MRQNFAKTKSEGPSKLLIITVNFYKSFVQNLTNFHPFLMALTKISLYLINFPIFSINLSDFFTEIDKILCSLKKYYKNFMREMDKTLVT
jgi:hypothetical protein